MASWYDRLKPLKRWFDLMSTAALLLLFSGAQALAEDEPAARAPLPPPLRGAPGETGERQLPDTAASRDQHDPGAPATRFDRPRSQLSQKRLRLHSASYLGTPTAKKRETPARLGNHSSDTASHRGRRIVASEKGQRRVRSPTEPEIGSLSPPREYPDPRIGSTAVPPQAPPPYHPNYFAGPPAYGYAPSYPYAWAPPGPGLFR